MLEPHFRGVQPTRGITHAPPNGVEAQTLRPRSLGTLAEALSNLRKMKAAHENGSGKTKTVILPDSPLAIALAHGGQGMTLKEAGGYMKPASDHRSVRSRSASITSSRTVLTGGGGGVQRRDQQLRIQCGY